MNWLEYAIMANAEKYHQIIADALNKKKEATTMQVSYNGFTGELVKLMRAGDYYELQIFDSDKCAHITFVGVKLEDVKFLGGAVSFDG